MSVTGMLVRDPIHGDISLTALETAVLDLADVQRLRGIKQLGTANLVFPGCVHTRFDHSLGASASAKRIVAAVRAAGTTVAADLEQLIAIGALLHDVTHVPFGHTLEDERRLFARHDKGTRLQRLWAGQLGDSLRRLGVDRPLAELLGLVDRREIPLWAQQVVSSTIDADLLDYLRRDSYFAGLAQGYDDRIFRSFVVEDGQLAILMAKHGMERHDVRSEAVQLLRMRYFLTERVYYHHTKVIAGAMISKAVELAHRQGAIAEEDLLQLNDWTLLEHLRRVPNPAVVDLVERLEQRRLFKRGYVISAHSVGEAQRQDLVRRFHESAANRQQAEGSIAAELGCEASKVIVYCPALTVMKEASAMVCTPSGLQRLNQSDRHPNSEIEALQARYALLWRLYVLVAEDVAAGVGKVAQDLFGYPNEHR